MRAMAFLAVLLGAGDLAGFQSPAALLPIVLKRHFDPSDRMSGRYQYLPFDVPVGTTSLRIDYQYDRANGENVVDLGLFEPGPLDLGTRAFRGYSGGSKSSVIVGGDDTTPGYRPGPLPSGRWHVLLGLYRVRDAGVDVTVTIGRHEGSSRPERRVRPEPGGQAPPSGLAWFKGALHAHTLHSDGTVEPAELLRRFRDAQFDFVAITDHNNTTHAGDSALAKGGRPLWIVGEEVTTPGGHANVWGLKAGDWVDFRVSPHDGRIGELVASARRMGGLFSINHPASECLACGWEHEVVNGIESIEISNGRHGEVERALAIWDRLLMAGKKLTGVGSSDWHSDPNPIDVANVRVFAESLTEPAILAAIRAGHVIVMGRGGDATPAVTVRSGQSQATGGDTLRLANGSPISVEVEAADLRGGGKVIIVTNGKRSEALPLDTSGRLRVSQQAEPGYIRIEIYRTDGSLFAATNPVYLTE